MNFDFTEDQLALRDLVRKFVEREMPKDAVAEWDAKGVFPEGLLGKMAEIGLMGASVPEEFGGTGGGVVEETIVLEELARHSSTVALAYGLDISFGAVTIERHGSDQRTLRRGKNRKLNGTVGGRQCHSVMETCFKMFSRIVT